MRHGMNKKREPFRGRSKGGRGYDAVAKQLHEGPVLPPRNQKEGGRLGKHETMEEKSTNVRVRAFRWPDGWAPSRAH